MERERGQKKDRQLDGLCHLIARRRRRRPARRDQLVAGVIVKDYFSLSLSLSSFSFNFFSSRSRSNSSNYFSIYIPPAVLASTIFLFIILVLAARFVFLFICILLFVLPFAARIHAHTEYIFVIRRSIFSLSFLVIRVTARLSVY